MRRSLAILVIAIVASALAAAQQPAPSVTVKRVVVAAGVLPASDLDHLQQAMQARLCPKAAAEACIAAEARRALQQVGYVKAEVKTAKLEFPDKTRPLDVIATLDVVPGYSYTLKDMKLKGAESLSFWQKYKVPKPETGKRFDVEDINRAANAIVHAYTENGKSAPVVIPNLTLDDVKKEVTVLLDVEEQVARK